MKANEKDSVCLSSQRSMTEIEFEVEAYKNVSGGVTFQVVGTRNGLTKLEFVHQIDFQTIGEFDARMFHYFEATHRNQNSFHEVQINCTKKFKFAKGNGTMYLREIEK